MSGLIATVLVATISGLVLAGSRVTEAVTRDLVRLSLIGQRTSRNVPRNAILLQIAFTVALLLTGSVERVMTYAGFTLNLNTLLAVIGVYVLRRREPGRVLAYRTLGYPLVPFFFILTSVWTLGFVLTERPLASLAGLVTIVVGVGIHWWDSRGAVAA